MQRFLYQLKNKSFVLSFLLAALLSWAFTNPHFSQKNGPVSNRMMSCVTPANVSLSQFGLVVDIWWSSVPSAVKYQIEIGLSGFEPGIGSAEIHDETITPLYFGVNGLEGATQYEVYVRAICSNGDTSDFNGPSFFATPPTCGDTFYDLGGPNGNYPPDQSMFVEICPQNQGEYVQLIFNEFDVDPCCSSVTVDATGFDVHFLDPAGPLPDPITSYQVDGCLAFSFFPASGQGVGSGWDIDIVCTTCPPLTSVFIQHTTANSVTFNLDQLDVFQEIKWELGEQGFLPNTGDEIASGFTQLPAPSQTIPGLGQGKAYDLYVWNSCGQDVSIPFGPIQFTTAPTCGQTFYDPGGPDQKFLPRNNIPVSTTICPDQAGKAVEVNFTEFELNPVGGSMVINDGATIFDPLLYVIENNDHDGYFASSHPSGCLTFRFILPPTPFPIADSIPGWSANVNCLTCPPLGGLELQGTTTTSAVIGWDATLNAEGYEWEVGPHGFVPGTGNAVASGTNSSNSNLASVIGLERASYYDFYVRALCGTNGIGNYYFPLLFSTQATCGDLYYDPGGPNNAYDNNLEIETTICSSIPDDPVTVSFNIFSVGGNGTLSVYDGFVHTGNLRGILSGSLPPPPITAADPNGCLVFKFSSGTADVGNGWEANVECLGTPVTHAHQKLAFELFPNPGNSSIFIQYENWKMEALEVEIKGITGQTVFSDKLSTGVTGSPHEINISHLPAGTYLCILKNDEMTGVQRFLKIE
ncbi:MAG: T9SS type A sorting domain-containing protein [Bacteroidota bacterium]